MTTTPTDEQLAALTQRESAAMRALIDKRLVYRATGHGIAASTMGLAIWLVWQVWQRLPHEKDAP